MHCFICHDTCMLASGFFVLAVLSALLTISAAEKKACETGKAYPKSGAKADARLQPHSEWHSKLIKAIRTIVLIANCHSILLQHIAILRIRCFFSINDTYTLHFNMSSFCRCLPTSPGRHFFLRIWPNLFISRISCRFLRFQLIFIDIRRHSSGCFGILLTPSSKSFHFWSLKPQPGEAMIPSVVASEMIFGKTWMIQ